MHPTAVEASYATPQTAYAYRRQSRVRGAVSQLPSAIPTPTLRRATRQQCTAVITARRVKPNAASQPGNIDWYV